MVPQSPFHLNLSGVKDFSFLTPYDATYPSPRNLSGPTDPPPLSSFMVPQTPSSQPFWCHGHPPLNLSGATDPSLLTHYDAMDLLSLKLPGAKQPLPKIISYSFTKQDID
jgi:hypothetical protein